MVKCNFCGETLPQGGGKIYAKKDGTTYHFCSGKCEKNLIEMKRKPVETKWTTAHNKHKQTMLSAKGEKKEDASETKKENPKQKNDTSSEQKNASKTSTDKTKGEQKQAKKEEEKQEKGDKK